MASVIEEKRDDGVTEVIAFVLILGMIFVAGMIWLTIAVPAQEEKEEFAHANMIQMEFSEFKTDVDNIWMANNTGVIFQQVFTLSPNGRQTDVSIMPSFFGAHTSGTLSLEKSNTKIVIYNSTSMVTIDNLWQLHFRSSNVYAKNIEVLYIAGAIFVKFGDDIWFPAVNPSMSSSVLVVPNVANDARRNQAVAGEDTAIVEFRMNSTNNTQQFTGSSVFLEITAEDDMVAAWQLMLEETTGVRPPNGNPFTVNLNSNVTLVQPEYLIGVK